MEKELNLLEIKKEILTKQKLNYLYIGDFDLESKIKLLLKIFEKAPVVDDSIVDYEILQFFAKEIIERDEIGYWFGRRLDISFKHDYILSTVFNEYVQENIMEKLIDEVRKEKKKVISIKI